MNIERIGYRYSNREIAALLRMLKLPPIHGIETPELSAADYTRVTEELTNKSLVLQDGAQVYIDRISALLLKTMTDSAGRIEIRSGKSRTLLYCGSKLCITADFQSGAVCILSPFPSLHEAASALKDSLAHRRGSIRLMFFKQELEHLLDLDCADAADAKMQIDSFIEKARAFISRS